MRNLRHTLLAVTASLACLGTTSAQITPLPNSGCPGMPTLSTTGNARLTTTVRISCPPSIDRMRVLIGVSGQRSTFQKPMMCVSNCVLDMLALVLWQSPSISIAIPNDPTLVGQSINVQCLQTSLNRPCLLLTPGVNIKVQR